MSDMLIDVVRLSPLQGPNRTNRVLTTLRWLLPWQLAHTQITSLSDANRFLHRYWPRFNEAFAVTCHDDQFEPLAPETIAVLDNGVFCLKGSVVVGRDNCVVHDDRRLHVPTAVRTGLCGQEVTICEYEDGALAIMDGLEVLVRY